MTPFWQDDHLTLYGGDCRAVLAELPAESVHCVVTSPPYWGLRDYGTATWEGGDAGCDHDQRRRERDPDSKSATAAGQARDSVAGSAVCRKCGAHRIDSQLGLEPTPEAYVENMVAVFREVRRVLRADGTLWLNLGDSYSTNQSTSTTPRSEQGNGRGAFRIGGKAQDAAYASGHRGARRDNLPGLKLKDLVGIPWAVAKALQAPYYTGKIRDERDRAWLAGWVDGEGTVSFVERDRGPDHTPTHDARIYVTNTDREPLDYFASICGGRVYLHDDGTRENRYGSRPCYRWQMGTHDGALLLRELYPYLRTKRRQAALIWTLYTTLRHKNGHARTPDAVVARRREIAGMVRTLNAGGDVTLPSWVEEPPSPTEPGWYLRAEIIWSKPNPMPESVTDRPTKAHEQIFLFSKEPRYYFDAEAVREAGTERPSGNVARKIATEGERSRLNTHMGSSVPYTPDGSGRNLRSVWTIATEPYPGAHFATFPRKLVEPCVKAGTSERGVCPECGAPWRRETLHVAGDAEAAARPKRTAGMDSRTSTLSLSGNGSKEWAERGGKRETTGWSPSCSHSMCLGCSNVTTGNCPCGGEGVTMEPVPAVVLDPFAGSGTTLLVAQALGRRGIGIDLNPDYLKQALARNAQTPLGLVG